MKNLYRLPRHFVPPPAALDAQHLRAGRNDGGFTLFEIMLVMALMVAVTAIGIINLARLQSVFSLRSSADEIKAEIQYGRELAVANKDSGLYNVTGSVLAFKLLKNGGEISRYQIPQGMVMTPLSFSWNFTPLTGALNTCSPCQISLFFRGLTEIINIQANGIVD